MTSPAPALSIEALQVCYPGQAEPVLDSISATFGAGRTLDQSDSINSVNNTTGQLCAIIGPNGAGKSTLIKAILGFIPVQNGTINIFGESLTRSRRKIAYVPQRSTIDWDFPISVREIVLQGLFLDLPRFSFFPPSHHKEIVREALGLVGLVDMENRQISQLSGGQQQRMFIARAIAQSMMKDGAELFLLDEPFTGIDAHTESALIAILKNLAQQGKTILAVHHNLSTVADYFDSSLFLNRKIIAYGHINDVFTDKNIRKTYLPQPQTHPKTSFLRQSGEQ